MEAGYALERQNIDSTGLAAKILTNKELMVLTPATGRAGLAPDCSGSVGTVPLWTFHMLGQGCWSQDRGIFLWMAVQKCGVLSTHRQG